MFVAQNLESSRASIGTAELFDTDLGILAWIALCNFDAIKLED